MRKPVSSKLEGRQVLPQLPGLIAMAFDCKLMKIGCPLLQALMGGDCKTFSELFGGINEHWTIVPTPDLKLRKATLDQWQFIRDKLDGRTKNHRQGQ